ncbi:MAG: allantoinase PuuE [Pseudomonadota bacterium]
MARKPAPYPRDLKGYGERPPHPRWPGEARVAVQFVLNYEEGGENSVLHGDPASEVYLHEVVGLTPRRGRRDEAVESVYEYGPRAGFWRILRLFAERNLPFTSYAVGMAVERTPEGARAMVEAGHEVASHGWRWIDYRKMGIAEERRHMRLAIAAIEKACGVRPLGWYTGRVSPNTRKLVVAEGGFLYDSDAYNDDLPYWVTVDGNGHLVIPYTLDNNDMKFGTAQGFNTGEDYFAYLRDAFDVLYREGETAPKMMSVGMHSRLAGRPGRLAGLARFLDHVQRVERVWICRRVDIARHWREVHPYAPPAQPERHT